MSQARHLNPVDRRRRRSQEHIFKGLILDFAAVFFFSPGLITNTTWQGPLLRHHRRAGSWCCFDHVFWAHHSGLARRALRDNPSERSDLSRQLRGLRGETGERERERVMGDEERAAMQILLTDCCCSCSPPPFEFNNVAVRLRSSVREKAKLPVLCCRSCSRVVYSALSAIKTPFTF